MSNKKTAGSSTLAAMNSSLANMTAAGQARSAPTRTYSDDAPSPRTFARRKSSVGKGIEPITYDGLIRVTDKKAKQVHTREEVSDRITALRKQVGDLYAAGKFSTNALNAVLTSMDNITFLKCSGEFDRAMTIADDLETRLDNA